MYIKTIYRKFNNFLASTTYLKLIDLLSLIPSKPVKLETLKTFKHNANINNNIDINGEATIKELGIHHIDDLLNFCPDKYNLITSLHSKGDKCLIASVNGKTIGYEWFSLRGIFIDERSMFKLFIPYDSMYAYDAYIAPEQRGKKLFHSLTQAAVKLCLANNRRFIMALIERENYTSLIAHSRLGFKTVEQKIYIIIFNKNISLKF